jgi:hypothetical protein
LSYNNDFTWFSSLIVTFKLKKSILTYQRVALTRLNKSHTFLTVDDFEWASSVINADYKEEYIRGQNPQINNEIYLIYRDSSL